MGERVGGVLVIGGGIAGIQASLDIADSGFKVYLLDELTSIGGVMAQLDKTFPTNDCSMCILAPKLVTAGRHPNIQLITNSTLEEVKGEAGNFEVTILQRPCFVDEERCNGCGVCSQSCPVEVPNEFDAGKGIRKAIYVPFPQAVPMRYAVDNENCIKCYLCEKLCPSKAVDFAQQPKKVEISVGSIILAPGFEEFDASLKREYGYGRYTNVVSSIEFERTLSASGPLGGAVFRPKDGKIPEKIAFIQCVGSRDDRTGNDYCSAVCCMYSIKESVIVKEHNPSLVCTIFYMDMRAYGKEFDDYLNRAKYEYGVRFVRSRVASVEEDPTTGNLLVQYLEEEAPRIEKFDMVVLATGMCPPKGVERLADILGIDLDRYRFCKTGLFTPVETSRRGVFVCGAFAGPKDIPESVSEASGAAAKAMSEIASQRGKQIVEKGYPPEEDVTGEEPRIGVFVCHCGINIGRVVDVLEVVEFAGKLPDVVLSESNLYTCSQDSQKIIKDRIREHHLNRVVVASCTPRTHEPLFRATCREAGLNPYLFEMANIREQCSWVHMHEAEKATDKAKDVVRMTVAKSRLLKPLRTPVIDVTPVGLVIGGGVSGLTASLELAKQGFKVHLVERDKELGGQLRRTRYLLEDDSPEEKLADLVNEVMRDKKIHVHLEAEVVETSGFVGNFRSKIIRGDEEQEIRHGIVIVAIGAEEYKPTEYLYGIDSRVITQRELEERITEKEFDAKKLVMIQCVGSRTQERPNCSRICCGEALKNALKVKEMSPETEIYVLYRDIRAYRFKEKYYNDAVAKGVVFVNYEDNRKPNVDNNDGSLKVVFWEPVLKEEIEVEPDLVVLSVATIPSPGNKQIAEMLKVPLTKDGFFLEAHMKLRPVDFATDGIFLCGMAHSPKYVDESIAQACAAASRATTILSKKTLEIEGTIADVNEDLCSDCRICEHLCPYNAIEMRERDGKSVAYVIDALCKGCGVCGAACPTKAITMEHFTTEEILAQVKAALIGEEDFKKDKGFEPKIIAFLCNWCSYAGADLAGVSRIQYPPNIRIIRVMCSGRVDPVFLMEALKYGADGVLVAGCHIPSDCHYMSGNFKSMIRTTLLKKTFQDLGIEPERVRLEWVSASEGNKFAVIVRDMIEEIRKLGPNPLTNIEV